MASLTESSVISRKIIRYSLYGFILVLILRFTILTSIDLYHKYFPEKPKATLAFGKLPKLPYPQKDTPTDISYTLELPQGKLPLFENLGYVYFMPPFQRNINALEEAREKARVFRFSPQEKQVAETIPNVYVFQSPSEPSNFTINIITGIFSIGYNFDSNPQAVSGIPPTSAEITGRVTGILSSANIFPEDFNQGPTHSNFLKIENGEFVEVTSLSEANLVRVDLFRNGYGIKGDIPAVTANFPNSNVWFMYAGGSKNPVVGEYHYFPVDKNRTATYPLKTAEQAWQELTGGKAFIANRGNVQIKNMIIRKVYMAYYDAGQYASFYQPIVVFEGENDFAAYVPAVANDYYGAEAKSSGN
jgi:hypothetical protein